jgi:hypothetical protein
MTNLSDDWQKRLRVGGGLKNHSDFCMRQIWQAKLIGWPALKQLWKRRLDDLRSASTMHDPHRTKRP